MYMNGQGVRKRTDELISKLWDETKPSMIFMVAGVLTVASFASLPMIFGGFHWFLLVLLWLAAFCAYRVITYDYRMALKEIRAHNDAVETETKKRGQGWAHS